MLKKRTISIINRSVLVLIICFGVSLLMKFYPPEIKSFSKSEASNNPIVNIFPSSTAKFNDMNLQESTVSTPVINYSTNDEKMDMAVLVGQFKIGKSTLELPNPKGHNTYKISAKGGRVLLSHRAYNPDGHTWSAPPGNHQLQYINITGETLNNYDIDINESHGKLDKVYLSNPNLWRSVNVEYSVQKAS